MKILALNFGSSSIKYQLFDARNNFQILIKGSADRIGQKSSSIYQWIKNEHEERREVDLKDHRMAMQLLYQQMIQAKEHFVKGIDAIGHRIVHGGDLLRSPTLINEHVIQEIKKFARFAPLHCQPNMIGIEISQELYPNTPQVAVFDTSVHASMEPHAFLYGIPMEYYEKYRIRKYGFHGINHQYVANEAAKVIKTNLKNLKVITCHLGNGCSITAFKNGKSIDNSMGLTPLEGLVMGTRSGDLDPSVILYLMEEKGFSLSELTDLLNKQSGLLGLCGKSDMRDIISTAEKGDHQSKIAIDVFIYRIQKYLGAFIAALNGVDAIVFTGGIGENSPVIRERILTNFHYVGAILDPEKNRTNQTMISSDDSKVSILRIAADEELVLAKETYQCAFAK